VIQSGGHEGLPDCSTEARRRAEATREAKMKKRHEVLVFLTVFSLLAIPIVVLAMSHGKMPEAEGKALHKYITQTNPYEKWEMWPGKEKLYKGTEPHGALLTTYVNETALKGITDKGGNLADGAIIVKENYMPDKKLAAVTVMYKKAGYNPEAGDYFWLKYTPDGKIEAEGKAPMCISCHRAAQGEDFLFTNDKK
jgi:hypothetical protein